MISKISEELILNCTSTINNISKFARNKKLLRSLLHRLRVFLSYVELLIPDERFAQKTYKNFTGEKLNLQTPRTYNEKLWWMKIHYRNPLQTQCTDKYLVRDYVKGKGLDYILTEIYGVYDNANDIPFDDFTEEVFLKCNHGSGTNFIYDAQKKALTKGIVKAFNFDLKHSHYPLTREWNYKDIKPKIICEEVLRNSDGSLPSDYKFMCFAGVPELLFLEGNVCDENGKRNTSGTRFVNVYDMNYSLLPISSGAPQNPGFEFSCSVDELNQMKEIARVLSEGFPHCRVDLYCVKGHIYFGEMTFYHGGACNIIRPKEWEIQMGDWIDLSSIPQKFIRE